MDLVRKLDKKNKVTAHGVASSLEALPSSTNNEWRSAADVDVWGFTWVASRKGSEPWKQFHAVDLVRAGARGKPFWHAEAQAGPLWMQPQVNGRPREDGRITDEKDVRLWNLISMAGGATGILYPRWIVGEYDTTAVGGNGCLGAEVTGAKMYIDSGAGSAPGNLYSADLYSFPVTGYSRTNTPDTPQRRLVFREEIDPADAHGAALVKDQKYLWVADRGPDRVGRGSCRRRTCQRGRHRRAPFPPS